MNIESIIATPVNYKKLYEEITKMNPGERRKRGLDGKKFDGYSLSKYFPEEADEAYMPGNDR